MQSRGAMAIGALSELIRDVDLTYQEMYNAN
jgi:hypothetical protein